MNKIFVLILLFVASLHAMSKDYWTSQYVVELKKDEILQIELTPKQGKQKILTYRWTLHKDGGLVVILRYDGFVKQFVLYPNYQVDKFKVFLYPETETYMKPFFLLKFLDFDRRKNIAKLQNFIHAAGMKINIAYNK